jgi:protein TonB
MKKRNYLSLVVVFLSAAILVACNTKGDKNSKTDAVEESSEEVMEVEPAVEAVEAAPVTDMTEIEVEEVTPDEMVMEGVSMAVVDSAPVFPGCEELSGEEQKACLAAGIQKHIARNFDGDLASELDMVNAKERILVTFKIDKNGDVMDIKAKAPHVKLEQEAVRVIKSLPEMGPGMHQGQAAVVSYAIPIVIAAE